MSVLNAAAAEFIPSQSFGFTELDDGDGSCFEIDAVADLNGSINLLRNNPEAFYDVAYPLCERLSSSMRDEATMTNVIETLFQQCCSDVNFRYTGARLCSLLYQSLSKDNAQSFRRGLLTRCSNEFGRRAELMAESHFVLTNFALFIGELMHSLTIDGQVIGILPKSIIQLLSDMLDSGTDECIRGFFQCMKLVGAILEKHESIQMHELFENIKKVTADDKTSVSNREKLLTLIMLRAEKWLVAPGDQLVIGTSKNAAPESLPVAESGATIGDENCVVYYEDCDEVEDELEDLCDDQDFEIIYDGNIPYAVPRDEMDPDVREEFEKFIAENEAKGGRP
jgi:hypothetical protein